MTLGQKLKKLRTDKGLTQKDLADQLHVTFQTVSKWESDTNEPDIATLKELAQLYGCTFDYLLNDEEEPIQKEESKEAVTDLVDVINKTIEAHERSKHICKKCGKEISSDDLAVEQLTKTVRQGPMSTIVPNGEAYYHKACWEQVKQERDNAWKKVKSEKMKKSKRRTFGWGIFGGVVALIIALLVLLINPQCKEIFHPVVAVLMSIVIGYGIFSMIYCILSGSYIGEVFVWCASLSVKFPMLIFSWSLEGLAWLIAMKILFAIAGFLIGLFALAFAIAFSSILGMISFPFVLIHNINTNYSDAF